MIIDDIRNEKKFQDDLSEINLFIGIKPYCRNYSRDAKELVITNFNNTLYEISEGHIAFIPEEESYPSSFLFLIKMLFDDFVFPELNNIAKKITNKYLNILHMNNKLQEYEKKNYLN